MMCAFDDFACGKRQRAGLLHGFFHGEHNDILNCGNLGYPDGGNRSSIA